MLLGLVYDFIVLERSSYMLQGLVYDFIVVSLAISYRFSTRPWIHSFALSLGSLAVHAPLHVLLPRFQGFLEAAMAEGPSDPFPGVEPASSGHPEDRSPNLALMALRVWPAKVIIYFP